MRAATNYAIADGIAYAGSNRGSTVESTPGHYRVLGDGKPLRKANGMLFMLPFSPDTIRWRRAAVVDLRRLGIHL